ncbi:MAG: 6,7-dimethyl-8-ribityllumazine synthase, partial [Phycisphaerae bacterium]
MSEKIVADLLVRQQRFALVVSRFNEFISSKLLSGAIDELTRHGARAEQITEVWVPGSFEIPLVARRLAETGRYAAIVALGCILRGETPHFDYIAAEAAKGLARVGLQTGVPCVFGIITAETLEQAIDRAGTKAGNKGADAARTAI